MARQPINCNGVYSVFFYITRLRWEDNIKWIFTKWFKGAWSTLIWFRIWANGGLLWRRQWTLGFHKMLGISWLSLELLASEVGPCSRESFILVLFILFSVFIYFQYFFVADEVTAWRLIIVPLKGWKSSNIWEQR